MRITDYAKVFFIIFLLFSYQLEFKVMGMKTMVQLQQDYDSKLDKASYDAMNSMIENDSGSITNLSKEECIISFYRSLYASFSIEDNSQLQNLMKVYVPVMVLMETDGYSIMYNDEVNSNGSAVLKQLWTEKKPFSYKDGNAVVLFTTSDYVTVILPQFGVYTGNAKTIATTYSYDSNFLSWYSTSMVANSVTNYELFSATRQTTITNSISKDLGYYVTKHNKIAKDFGVEYTFSLPQDSVSDFQRNVDDVSLMVIFQGYKIGTGINDYYNRVSFTASRSFKASKYAISQSADGFYYYHKQVCLFNTSTDAEYDNPKDAAITGAYPCPHCKP